MREKTDEFRKIQRRLDELETWTKLHDEQMIYSGNPVTADDSIVARKLQR